MEKNEKLSESLCRASVLTDQIKAIATVVIGKYVPNTMQLDLVRGINTLAEQLEKLLEKMDDRVCAIERAAESMSTVM
ncbi:MAG: hypothetical protein NC299_15270 [Lachnospiraceae bacterium]|nr:hypothetical protein [Lachnospiraceae bacterium]